MKKGRDVCFEGEEEEVAVRGVQGRFGRRKGKRKSRRRRRKRRGCSLKRRDL